MATKQNMELSHEVLENWKCPICLDVLYKPCVNTCGHVFCFWCMHRAMDPFTPSQCPLCRSQYAHFPQVCEQLHFFLQKAFPKEYSEREKETKEEEEATGYYSLQLHHTERQPNQVSDDAANTLRWTADNFECSNCAQLLYNPVVLNCGHAVCQETCRLWVSSNGERACSLCEATIIGNPSTCTQWQDQLLQLLPEEMQTRGAQCEASVRQDHACCLQHEMPDDKTAKKPAGLQQQHSQRAAGSSAGETGRSAAAVLRHRLLHNIRQDFMHHGVGCDSCGLYPIKGRCYNCQDCPDKIGFDLCGSCYDRGLHITGRFNQQHTPEHSMGLVRPQPTMFHIFQAANPELSMAQIQQLTALAFARDDHESAAQPGSAQTAGAVGAPQSPAQQLAGLADTAAAAARRSAALADRIQQIEEAALSGLATGTHAAANAGTELSGHATVASASADGDGSERSQWASAFIADARQAADAAHNLEQGTPASTAAAAAADLVAPASGEAQRRRPSFRQWFSSAPHRPPAAQHAASARPPAASRQRTSSTREQRRDNPPPRSTHNTEWRWNLGGPSTGGSSAGAYQVPRLPAHLAGGNSGSASGSSRSTEWRWNLGGSWQPPSNAPGQGQSSRSSQAAPTDARSADRSRPARNSSGDMQRPWQRRRMLAGSPSEQEASLQSAANEPARSAAWEHSSAAVGTARQAESGSGHNSQQGWRRLLPRFLGQMMPGVQTARQDQRSERVEVPAVQSTGMQTDLSGQQEQAAPPSSTAGVGSEAADTAADAGQPRQSQALVLPDVPNVWDDMNPAAEEMLPSPADSVEYINGADDNNMANDAMLLIMHAVQARSEGRSLRDDRRSSAEQYWRQMEEDEEAGFFRLSTDGDEAGRA